MCTIWVIFFLHRRAWKTWKMKWPGFCRSSFQNTLTTATIIWDRYVIFVHIWQIFSVMKSRCELSNFIISNTTLTIHNRVKTIKQISYSITASWKAELIMFFFSFIMWQGACIWLLTLMRHSGHNQALKESLPDIQRGFMRMLSENDGKYMLLSLKYAIQARTEK